MCFLQTSTPKIFSSFSILAIQSVLTPCSLLCKYTHPFWRSHQSGHTSPPAYPPCQSLTPNWASHPPLTPYQTHMAPHPTCPTWPSTSSPTRHTRHDTPTHPGPPGLPPHPPTPGQPQKFACQPPLQNRCQQTAPQLQSPRVEQRSLLVCRTDSLVCGAIAAFGRCAAA